SGFTATGATWTNCASTGSGTLTRNRNSAGNRWAIVGSPALLRGRADRPARARHLTTRGGAPIPAGRSRVHSGSRADGESVRGGKGGRVPPASGVLEIAEQLQPVAGDLETLAAQALDQAGADLLGERGVVGQRQVADLAGLQAAQVVVGLAVAVVAGRPLAVGELGGQAGRHQGVERLVD